LLFISCISLVSKLKGLSCIWSCGRAVLRCGERDFMDAIIRKAIVAKDINHKGQGLWVTMRKLLGDFAQVCVQLTACSTPVLTPYKLLTLLRMPYGKRFRVSRVVF